MSNQVAERISELISSIEKEGKHKSEIDELRGMIDSLKNGSINKESKAQKLKWLGKPEQFSYIFSELAKNGYIEIPSTNGEASYAKFAQVCFELFEFKKETTPGNLKRAFYPDRNTLSDSNRKKISIPDLRDIS